MAVIVIKFWAHSECWPESPKVLDSHCQGRVNSIEDNGERPSSGAPSSVLEVAEHEPSTILVVRSLLEKLSY